MSHKPRWVGRAVPRLEDERLLKGEGRYVGDLGPRDLEPGPLAHLVVIRADHPHARLRSVTVTAAQTMPGVLAVLTAREVAADGLGGVPWELRPPLPRGIATDALPPEGDASVAPPQPLLAEDVVRYQGEPVAVIVAETLPLALDAAERLTIDYEPLPHETRARLAIRPDAVRLWPQFDENVCFTIEAGDPQVTQAAFARAAHVAEISVDVPRLAQCPIEPRTYVGMYDAASEVFTLHATAGKPQTVGRALARDVFRVPEEKVRVITRDVGGGFGSKNVMYAEEALVLWAARRIGRAVRWTASRSESFLSDVQARDQSADAAIALDANGRITGLRIDWLTNLGAYLGPRGVTPAVVPTKIITSVYDIPAIDIRVRAVHTNTVPTCPYRGAGAPEAILVMEQLLEAAARATGHDPATLRRRNLVPAARMPYTNPLGVTYDSGDFAQNMDVAEALADASGYPARRAASAAAGRLRGLGYANMLESGGIGIPDRADVRVQGDGTVEIRIGTMSNGQSHETVYAQLLADALGIDLHRIRLIQGDSRETPWGMGTGASRSMTVGGSALVIAAEKVIATALPLAADLLEAAPADLAFAEGAFTVAGTDRRLEIEAVARAAGGAIEASHRYVPTNGTYPNGCHIAEVEIDPETGVVTVLRYVAAQDVGRALNPLVVEGQLVGGVVQGIGQALHECVIHDPASGQLLTGSFLDYAMPRADTMPAVEIRILEVPCTHTPTGIKSVGEAGTTAAPVAILNAVLDALRPCGVTDLALPLTTETVFRALADARR